MQTWGIAISASILQNELKTRLPPAFVAQFPAGVEIAYAVIPLIPGLEPGLQREVRDAFARSLVVLWEVMIGISGLGLLTVLLMKEIEMRTDVDQQWGLEKEKSDDTRPASSVEAGQA